MRLPAICFVGTYPPTCCGIATFAASLREAVPARRTGVVRVVPGTSSERRTDLAMEWRIGSPDGLARVSRALESFDIAIVQHEYGIYGGKDGNEIVELLRMSPIPTIVVLHTVLREPTPHQAMILRQLASLSDQIVTTTRTARRRLIDLHDIAPEQISVIPHGASVGSVGAPVGSRTILTWGLLGPGKGIEHGIEALAHLGDLHPSPIYIVAGRTHPRIREREGERYRAHLRMVADRAGVADRVVFDDRYLDARGLRALLARADIVLLPYDSTEQISSGVLVEAVAAGRPVVATAFPHALEQMSSACGIVVPHRDPEAIAEAIRRIITDRALSRSLMRHARREAEILAWPRVGRRYLDLIEVILGSPYELETAVMA